ncbi:hypothetical protein DRQ09_02285 [candidate division KSB1 bacterium]|nr:MAG: hypothetical protein DRQ09_02285 [candidate division KSB1 bacterium]
MFSRRTFLKAALASNMLGIPLVKGMKLFSRDSESMLKELKTPSSPFDEDYWKMVRKQFYIRGGVYLNTGTAGSVPMYVMNAVFEKMIKREQFFEGFGWDWKKLKKDVADFIGINTDELVFTRNTTEGMNFVANGLDLKPGDEILTTTHEHVGGLCMWELKAKRYGCIIKRISLPAPPKEPADLLNPFNDAISRKTKVISICHVTFTTGLLFPVKEFSRLCRDKGVILVVDGAHPPGMLNVNIHDLGCDFYATSTHKWLCAPKGTGLLFIKEDMADRLWTTIASGGWDDLSLKAERFNRVGTRNDQLIYGLWKAVEFQNAIGKDRIEKRIRQLNRYLRENLIKIKGLQLKTPMRDDMNSGACSFSIDGFTHQEIGKALKEKGKIYYRLVAEYGYNWIRLSTHIYNSFEEIDLALEILNDLVKSR